MIPGFPLPKIVTQDISFLPKRRKNLTITI